MTDKHLYAVRPDRYEVIHCPSGIGMTVGSVFGDLDLRHSYTLSQLHEI